MNLHAFKSTFKILDIETFDFIMIILNDLYISCT